MKVWVLVRPYDGAISEVCASRAEARRSMLHRLAGHLIRRASLVQLDPPFAKKPRLDTR